MRIKKINIPLHTDARGLLLALENGSTSLPFDPARFFIIKDVPQGETRANHAVDCDEFIMAIQGSFTLNHININQQKSTFVLNNCNFGLYIPAFHYLELCEFSSDAIAVVCASKKYRDTNYFKLDELQAR